MAILERSWLKRLTARVTLLESGGAVSVSASGGTVAAADASRGAYVSNAGATGAVVYALPAAKVGMRVNAVVQAAQALRLDPNGTETVALPTGVQQAAGKYIQASTVGATIQLVVLTAGKWDVAASSGTWASEA